MPQFNIATVTAAGAQLVAAALESPAALTFTEIAIGDGPAPAAPVAAAALTAPRFSIPVTKVMGHPENPEQTIVRGGFVNTGAQSNFYLREIGIMAKIAGSEEAPILFAYFNAGDTADFIPAVAAGSIVQQSLDLSIITGGANVLYAADPLAPATMADLTAAQDNLQTIVDQFTETKIQELQAIVSTLDTQLAAARQDLETHAANYVKRGGDTMTGDLTMADGAKVNGTATMWAGWTLYNALSEISGDLTAQSTLAEICAAMAPQSVLVADIATPHTAAPLPAGLLEIRKSTAGSAAAQFTNGNGLIFSAAYTSATGATAWASALGAAPGQGGYTFAAAPPLGWLACNGAEISRTTYAALFAAIGTTYGAGDGETTFNLPDTRGLFLRGLDAGRGLDPARAMGAVQQSAAPNIKGRIGAIDEHGDPPTGAFYRDGKSGRIENISGAKDPNVYLNAARASTVYKDGVNEIRPVNLPVIHIIKY